MISRENYFEPHIRELQKSSRGDPGLIERTLYAFGLLEALRRVGMEFTFKGGTSLLLLLSNPKRLSTDIDIVVDPGTDVDSFVEKAGTIFPFTAKEEQFREGKNNIVKRHFKFTYDSPVQKGPLYILLDVLLEDNHYERIVERSIENELLLTEGDNLSCQGLCHFLRHQHSHGPRRCREPSPCLRSCLRHGARQSYHRYSNMNSSPFRTSRRTGLSSPCGRGCLCRYLHRYL